MNIGVPIDIPEDPMTLACYRSILAAGGTVRDYTCGYFFAFMPTEALLVDMKYNRLLNMKQTDKMVNNFNTHSLGVALVNWRESSDEFFCFDGQHRNKVVGFVNGNNAKHRPLIPPMPMTCHIYPNLPPEEEALCFLQCNADRVKPNALTDWYAKLQKGDKIQIDATRAIHASGVTLARFSHNAGLKAVGAIKLIMDLDTTGWLLREVLSIAYVAWPEDIDSQKSLENPALHGLAMVWLKYHERINKSGFILRLRNKTYPTIRESAREMNLSRRNTGSRSRMEIAYANCILDVWNYGRHESNRLPYFL
jgi:hypothetical protein